MSSNVKTIRFSARLSFIFLVLTYLVCVNMEVGFLQFNTVWVSNNFALTVCGGVFASLLVVLACEFQKYYENKRNTENLFYSHLVSAYIKLTIMQANIEALLSHPEQTIPPKAIDSLIDYIQQEINFLRNVDYTPLIGSKKDQAFSAFWQFEDDVALKIENFLKSAKYLEIAVNTDQIHNLEKNGHQGQITSASHDTHIVLEALQEMIVSEIQAVDHCITIFNNGCGNRYHWDDVKSTVTAKPDDKMFYEYDEFIQKYSAVSNPSPDEKQRIGNSTEV